MNIIPFDIMRKCTEILSNPEYSEKTSHAKLLDYLFECAENNKITMEDAFDLALSLMLSWRKS